MNYKLSIMAGAALAMLAAGEAAAQSRAAAPARAAAAAPAATPIPQGPAIPGVCVVNPNAAVEQSTVGQYLRTRLQTIGQQVNAELQPEQTSLVADAKTFQAQRASMDQATLQTRGQALQAREVALEQKAQLRQREMQATQEKALGRIDQEMDPVLRALYVQHRCSLLLRAPAYMVANPDMDLTPSAIAGLNSRLTQFPIDREHLDTAPANAPAR
ncbi:MAG TPA: OmpH family outer membrane protein [Caulobacteraceae bacterium]|jgi:outer membrane protein|nr:OmpH family outer membrane protein [Caulobacteraceae bacterium]